MIAALILSVIPYKNCVFAEGDTPFAQAAVQERTSYSYQDANALIVKALTDKLVGENANKSDMSKGMFTWDTEAKTRGWLYYNGLMLDALGVINKDEYVSFIEKFYRDNTSPDGTPKNYNIGELDSVEGVAGIFVLLDTSPDSSRYKKTIQYVYTELEKQVMYPSAGNNYLHKQNSDGTPKTNWTEFPIGLDGAYMSKVFLYKCADAIDSGMLTLKKNNGDDVASTELRDLAYEQMMWMMTGPMLDQTTGLLNHGYNPNTGEVNGVFWTRSIGWILMAVAECSNYITDNTQKENMVAAAKDILDALMLYQDESTGLWYNVTNYGTDLPGNQLETSGTAMIAYSMMKLYTDGLLADPKYGYAGLKAFNGIVENCMKDGSLSDVYISSGVSTNPADYNTKAYTTNEAKGVGPLIFAAHYVDVTREMLNEERKIARCFANGTMGIRVIIDA